MLLLSAELLCSDVLRHQSLDKRLRLEQGFLELLLLRQRGAVRGECRLDDRGARCIDFLEQRFDASQELRRLAVALRAVDRERSRSSGPLRRLRRELLYWEAQAACAFCRHRYIASAARNAAWSPGSVYS